MGRVRGIYGLPLVRHLPDKRQIEKVKKAALERAGKYAIREIQREIRRASWNKTPTALLRSFAYQVKESSLIITSDHPAAHYLDKGVDPHQMIYLERADRPIPIITAEGDVIFRQATSKTMADGSWQHPGIKGKHFLTRGVERARERIKEEVSSSYAEFIKESIVG